MIPLIKFLKRLFDGIFTIFIRLDNSSVVSYNYLCTAMKQVTFIFLLLFSFVQVVPTFMNYCDTTLAFIAEEKNGEEKNESAENKDQKYLSQFPNIAAECSSDLNTAFPLAEKIYTSPCLEKLTPPPNFS